MGYYWFTPMTDRKFKLVFDGETRILYDSSTKNLINSLKEPTILRATFGDEYKHIPLIKQAYISRKGKWVKINEDEINDAIKAGKNKKLSVLRRLF